MYGVTPNGWVTKPYETIRQELGDRFRAEIDPLMVTDDQSPAGQIVAVLSAALAEVWEAAGAAYAARYPDSASDSSLDAVASITGTTRDAATRTTVDGQVTLAPNTALPLGSVAHLSGQPNARFVTTATVAGSPTGGTFTVEFESENGGFVQVLPGALNTIAEPVTGWQSVDNAAGPTFSGTDREDDSELRIKRDVELSQGGSTNVDAIRADLSALSGVVDAQVTEDLAAGTINAILRGGTAQEIADQIFASRAAGITSTGATSATVIDSQGVAHTERWDVAVQLSIHAAIEIEVAALKFDPVNGPAAIKAGLAAYINALPIGGAVVVDFAKCAIIDSTPGITRINGYLHGVGAAAGDADLNITPASYATMDVANVAVTVV